MRHSYNPCSTVPVLVQQSPSCCPYSPGVKGPQVCLPVPPPVPSPPQAQNQSSYPPGAHSLDLGGRYMAPRGRQERSKRVQEHFLRLQEASKSVPRGFQEAFGRHSAPEMRSEAMRQTSVPNAKPKTARFWSLLGSLLGAFWPLRWLKPVLEFFWERPRAVQEFFCSAPEASKSAPRGVQERPVSPWKPPFGRPSLFKGSKRPPRGLQGPFRSHVGTILEPFCSHMELSLSDFATMLVTLHGRSQGPSIQGPRPGGMREAIE